MKKETICGMVVNLSNFTNSASKQFRNHFARRNSLKIFVNLSKIRSMTFGIESEPACIIIFSDAFSEEIEFITPDLSQFSRLTKNISDGSTSKVSIEKLRREDNLWHIYALGYEQYLDLIAFLDSNIFDLVRFKTRFEVGIMKYWRNSGLSREQYYRKYRSPSKISDEYLPIVDSLEGVQPYVGKEAKEYLKYGSHLDRARNRDLFKDEKLVVTRSWPVKAFLNFKNTLFDGNFFVFKLGKDYPKEYLYLFEAILNSKLAHFYLGVKYLLRQEGNYSKVNLENLEQFPIPDLENQKELVKSIVDKVKSIVDSYGLHAETKKLQDELDGLIFRLYNIDYYAVQQIEHYYKLEKERAIIVTSEEMRDYCEEFIETLRPVIKDELCLIPNWNISDFFGTMVRFTIAKTREQFDYDNRELERFISLIEKHEIEEYDRKRVFMEEKLKFYDDKRLYIYKSNRPKDWTRLMAINDANEEIGLFFQKLGEYANAVSTLGL